MIHSVSQVAASSAQGWRKPLLLFPAPNHFALNSQNTASVIDLETRDHTSDHMIFVIADELMLNVVDSEGVLRSL